MTGEIIGLTSSLCPVCLKRIDAKRVAENDCTYLKKTCPEHGRFRTLIWRGGRDSYLDWEKASQEASPPIRPITDSEHGCPFDCGLCQEHLANACTMVLEVTDRCNLGCPVCFASSGSVFRTDPDLETIASMYETVLQSAGKPTIQLSGGEPTLRDDLPEIVRLGRNYGFEHIMVNSNGIRVAQEPEFTRRLADAGLGTLFLQFDGVTDDVYRYVRGSNLFNTKVQAIEECARAGIGVLLVATVKPSVNDHQLGDIVRFAESRIPAVRGIHIQPISYLGRYPAAPRDEDRLTIPDVIDRLVKQTGGAVCEKNFLPRRSHSAHCSFSSLFILRESRLKAVTRRSATRLLPTTGVHFREPWESARSWMQCHWSPPEERQGEGTGGCCTVSNNQLYEEAAAQGLTITCMPFQDVWSLDVERLRRCCGHVVTTNKRIVPFCAYYLTSASGRRLYREVGY